MTTADGAPSGATAAALNVTNTRDSSYLTAYLEGATQPLGSNLNWTAGETVANRVLVWLGSTGSIDVYNHSGSVDLVIDEFGYFSLGALVTVTYDLVRARGRLLIEAPPRPTACQGSTSELLQI